jgi:hypothetical protein
VGGIAGSMACESCTGSAKGLKYAAQHQVDCVVGFMGCEMAHAGGVNCVSHIR